VAGRGGPLFSSFIHPLLMKVTEFGFLKIAETVQYFLSVRRPQFGQ
jgi:hypothetical protein